jgi:hypothetical protein
MCSLHFLPQLSYILPVKLAEVGLERLENFHGFDGRVAERLNRLRGQLSRELDRSAVLF